MRKQPVEIYLALIKGLKFARTENKAILHGYCYLHSLSRLITANEKSDCNYACLFWWNGKCNYLCCALEKAVLKFRAHYLIGFFIYVALSVNERDNQHYCFVFSAILTARFNDRRFVGQTLPKETRNIVCVKLWTIKLQQKRRFSLNIKLRKKNKSCNDVIIGNEFLGIADIRLY